MTPSASPTASIFRASAVPVIASITGWPVDDFVATVEFYRNGARPNPAMISVAQSLDEDQIKALAAYYGSLPKPAKKSAQSR
jgi:cytochrome c553